MKKIFSIIMVLLIGFAICSCGADDKYAGNQTVILKNTNDHKNITIKLDHQDDEITKLSQKEIISFESLGVDNALDAQSLLDPKIAMIPDIDGYENKIEVTEKHVIETVKIDFKNIDADQIYEVPGLNFIGEPNEKISLEQTIKELEKSGFKEVEDKE